MALDVSAVKLPSHLLNSFLTGLLGIISPLTSAFDQSNAVLSRTVVPRKAPSCDYWPKKEKRDGRDSCDAF